MTGAKGGEFRELISPFLRFKLAEAERQFGSNSPQYLAISRQYVRSPLENLVSAEDRRRHYESELTLEFDGRPVIGVERLYRRTILIEPTTVCAAHCRWCLRGQYPIRTMTRADIDHAARYIGSPELADDVDEVLVTGGDPLMSLPLLTHTIGALQRFAPNIRILRIGSRVPFQDPDRVNGAMLEFFDRLSGLRLELGVNVNHPVEFWPESVAALQRLQNVGFRIYNQHPLLKGVNDDRETLVAHYSKLRELDIEAHYLFHAIPLRGMAHHRTSLTRGLELANILGSNGEFSGRSKPRFAVLSDVGKIVIYHDTVVDHRVADNSLLLRSGFRLDDRLRWNPNWTLPQDTIVDTDGTLLTWYRDGNDDVAIAPLAEAAE